MGSEYKHQSTCIAIQDAVDNIRNTTNIANTASGVALSKILECGADPSAMVVLEESKKMISNAIENYERIMSISEKNKVKKPCFSLRKFLGSCFSVF